MVKDGLPISLNIVAILMNIGFVPMYLKLLRRQRRWRMGAIGNI
jgi:hypothetical protein